MHEATSSGKGFLFSGGRHFKILHIYTSSLFSPIASIIFVSSMPALPTNGLPCASSSKPGASPINISFACVLPEPKTTFFLVFARSQFRHFSASFCKASNPSSFGFDENIYPDMPLSFSASKNALIVLKISIS